MRPSRTPAFTLLEVLIALAIFALAAVVLGASYVNVLSAYASLNRRNELDADVKFVRAMLLTEPDRTKVEAGGDVELAGEHRAHWAGTLEDTETADLFRVTFNCEISGADLSTPFRVQQVFMLLRPTWSDPATRDKLRQAAKERIQNLASPP